MSHPQDANVSFYCSSDETVSSKRSRLQHGRQNSSEAAKQLIKENNEILERLSKRQTSKTSPTDTKPSTSTTMASAPVKSAQYVVQCSPANKPITFNPFPNRQKKKPKEVGLKLGLYPAK